MTNNYLLPQFKFFHYFFVITWHLKRQLRINVYLYHGHLSGEKKVYVNLGEDFLMCYETKKVNYLQ